MPLAYISVIGNIAVGKSTFIEGLKDQIRSRFPDSEIVVVNEGIDKDLLNRFNTDPSNFVVLFQISMIYKTAKSVLHINHINNGWNSDSKDCWRFIIEDTTFSSNMCFTKANFKCNYITEDTYNLLCGICSGVLEGLVNARVTCCATPTHLLLLDCPPGRCVENIKKRNRSTECSLTESYLNELRNSYLEYFDSCSEANTLKMKVDASDSFADPVSLLDWIVE